MIGCSTAMSLVARFRSSTTTLQLRLDDSRPASSVQYPSARGI